MCGTSSAKATWYETCFACEARKLSISQKYIKFKNLLVCKGYLLKWSIITLSSDLDLTLKSAFVPNSDTLPTEKKFFIAFNNSKSLLCKVIPKLGAIVQPIAVVLDFETDILNEPSASTNPVTHQGFKDIIFLLLLLSLAESLSGILKNHLACVWK